ncbi:hypothetical protein JXB02_06700 [Candidatus Woesearchaeota archaeon]|nr:hypothetical protein [Candidatus Woesearchaeota archaeon]
MTGKQFPYPINGDEWNHLALARSVRERRHLTTDNPQSLAADRFVDLEPGFHLSLASLFALTGLDGVLGYRFLPALLWIFNALAIVAFVHAATGRQWAGILAAAYPGRQNILCDGTAALGVYPIRGNTIVTAQLGTLAQDAGVG